MENYVAQTRMLEIIVNTLSPLLPDGCRPDLDCTESDGGSLYLFLSAPRPKSATTDLRYGLDIAFIMPKREWAKFKSETDTAQVRLLTIFQQSIARKLDGAFAYWGDKIDLSVPAQSDPSRLTFIEFDDFGQ